VTNVSSVSMVQLAWGREEAMAVGIRGHPSGRWHGRIEP
jgi:hypothetical protein